MKRFGQILVALSLGIAVSGPIAGTAFGAEVANMDNHCSPTSDFYVYANGTWLKKTPIPDEYDKWGQLNIIHDKNLSLLKEIMEAAAAKEDAEPGSNEQKIGDFYAAAMNTEQIEKDDLTPLKEELDAIAAVLPLRPRGAGLFDALPGALPLQLFGHAPFVDRIARRATIVSPQSIAGSDFNLYHSGRAAVRGYKTLTELFGQVEARLRASTAPAYLYAYYAELDTLAHIHGVGSDQLAAQFALLDAAFGNFLAAIADTDTVVLACADHGFIDSPPERQIELAQHPELAATLARPLCGERRVVYCYVKPDKETRFVDYVQDVLGECADLFSGSELIAQGWFGPGEADPRLAARIGDYVLLMRENWTLRDWVEGEKRYKQLGVHAGVSADEMHVPLILARCGA